MKSTRDHVCTLLHWQETESGPRNNILLFFIFFFYMHKLTLCVCCDFIIQLGFRQIAVIVLFSIIVFRGVQERTVLKFKLIHKN